MNKKIVLATLIVIFLTALGLRLYKLTDVPPGLNRDEASIGYTAYSLLKTGRDEYGKKWPLSFKSFGDWKVPAYFYIDIPVIAVFGLSEFATRFPSAFLGSLTVLLVYFLVKTMLQDDRYLNENLSKYNNSFIELTAILSAFLFAISPWSLFMSRNASESNIAVFFVTFALCLFFKSFEKPILLIWSFLLLSLSLFAYHGNHIFTPLLLLILCVIYWKILRKNKWLVLGLIIFSLFVSLILSQTLFSADKTKISGLFPLSDVAKVYQETVLRRLEYSNINIFVKILHNKPLYLIKTVIINYIKGLSPEFLFINGGTNFQHNIPDFGNLYIWEVFIWPISLFFLIKNKNKYGIFLLFWLLISPIPASITRDAPHTAREMGILPLPAILSGYGIAVIIFWLKKRKLTFIGIIFFTIIILSNLIIYLDQYYVHFPYASAKNWGYGFKELVYKTDLIKNKYKEIIISKPEISPYIYFLFYDQVDPNLFQREVVRYPETVEGFQHVKSFANYKFQKIDWSDELMIPNRLYIDMTDGIPSGATNSAIYITKSNLSILNQKQLDTTNIMVGDYITSRIVDKILLPDKTPLYYLIETQIGTPSASEL